MVETETFKKKDLFHTAALQIADSSLVIQRFDLEIRLEPGSSNASTDLHFTCHFALASLFDVFFSLKRYRYNVEWRILQIIRNLNHFAHHRRP